MSMEHRREYNGCYVGSFDFRWMGKFPFHEVGNSSFRAEGIFGFPQLGETTFRGLRKNPCLLHILNAEEGLVAYYPFNGNANDESGNGNNGTENGGVTLISDRLGNANSAFSFDGVDDYIRVLDDDSLDITDHFSVSFFIKTPLSQTGYFFTKHKASVDGDGSWFLELQPNNTIMFESTPFSDYSVITGPITVGTWNHVAFTFDHGTDNWNTYVNGQLTGTGTRAFSIGNTAIDLIFGAHMNNSGGIYNFYEGELDDIRIYNRALSEAEITALYEEDDYTLGKIVFSSVMVLYR